MWNILLSIYDVLYSTRFPGLPNCEGIILSTEPPSRAGFVAAQVPQYGLPLTSLGQATAASSAPQAATTACLCPNEEEVKRVEKAMCLVTVGLSRAT